MIFFYHCYSLLPGEWRFVTIFGNSLGNNLFFMVSGFALYPSVVRSALSDFPGWYGRRLLRILPMLLLFYIISYFSGFYSLDPGTLFTVFVFPSLYWFVTGILFFYILVFFIGKQLPFILLPLLCMLSFVLWIIRPGTVESYYFIGFAAMLLGFILRRLLEDHGYLSEGGSWLFPVSAVLTLISFLLFIFINARFTDAVETLSFIRLCFGLTILITGAGALISGFLKNEELSSYFSSKPGLYLFLSFTGDLALPLYMVQCFNAGMIGYQIGQRIVFPLSFALNFIIVIGAASLLELLRRII